MTDINIYKNVSLKKETYHNLDRIRKTITPHLIQSRSGTIDILINNAGINRAAKKKYQNFIQG